MREFDYDLDYKNLDLRKHPELYRVGRGEQGVLLVEPYKSEILPHWRFATPDIAHESSETIRHSLVHFRPRLHQHSHHRPMPLQC